MFVSLPMLAAEGAVSDREPEMELVWPPAPLDPRIRYLDSIATPEDIERETGFWGQLVEFIHGPDEEDMRKPMAVAATTEGRIYVADPAGKRVHVFDQRKGKYFSIMEADIPFEQPIGVALDSEGKLYVADSMLRKICVFSPDGKYKHSIGEGLLQRPTGIAIDRMRSKLYVADTPAHDIKVFGLEDGKPLRIIGERGVEDGQFNFPSYVAVDNEGQFYVTDTLNGRIQMFGVDGVFLGAFGQFGDGSGDFTTPKGVAVDSEGHIYVADVGFDNLQIFNDEGQLLLFFGSAGQAPGEFWMPTGIYMDAKDRLYVADSYNKRIQIFQYLKLEAKQ